MNPLYSVWEYRPDTNGWWIHRSGFYFQLARDVADALNNDLQSWRKQEGVRFKVFPTSVNPNETRLST